MHGGFFAIGSAAASLGLASDLARKVRMQVVTVDYRLAPEHPYPAAPHDARRRGLRPHGTVSPAWPQTGGQSRHAQGFGTAQGKIIQVLRSHPRSASRRASTSPIQASGSGWVMAPCRQATSCTVIRPEICGCHAAGCGEAAVRPSAARKNIASPR